MSIVERAVERFGVFPEHRKDTAQIEEAPAHKASLAERAMMSSGTLAQGSENADVIPQTPPAGAPAKRAVARSVSIDFRRLGEQQYIVPDAVRTPIAENFRRIKRHVIANTADPKCPVPNLIMVTSALPKEGKTFCAINLAISLALEIDRSVILVDADVANPSIGAALGIDIQPPGLMDLLRDSSLCFEDLLCRTNIEKLAIVPAGSTHGHATEVLASETTRTLLQDFARRCPEQLIVFDAPPLLAASEACALASCMGQIVVVAEAGRTTEAALKEALSRIESCRVAGVVLNRGNPRLHGNGTYGYGYGYGYGA